MINFYNDMYNCKVMIFIGSNVVEVYLVVMQYILCGKENGVCMIVVDLCFIWMVVYVDLYVWLCLGIDVGFIYGMLWYIFKNGWEDKQYIF